MVKKWIIILSIITLLIVSCCLEYKFVNDSFEFLKDRLETYQIMLDKDKENINTEENILFIEQTHKKWHKKLKVLKALIWHTGIKDVEVGLARIKTYTQENEYTEALTEVQSLKDYVWHYSQDFTITLENLF